MSTNTVINKQKSNWLKGNQLLLSYQIKEPKIKNETNGNPLVLLLHGVGSNENDLFRFRHQFPEDFYVVSARAPYQLGKDLYAWYAVDFSTGKPVYNKEQAIKSRLLIVQFINQLLEKYQINKEKVYLFGFSQGAIMSYSVATHYPQKINSIFALSGRILIEDQEIIAKKKKLDVHVYISHSKNDHMLPYSGALHAQKILRDKVNSIHLITHDAGHAIPMDIFKKIDFE
jgi:phospholipase/carboxylesterase